MEQLETRIQKIDKAHKELEQLLTICPAKKSQDLQAAMDLGISITEMLIQHDEVSIETKRGGFLSDDLINDMINEYIDISEDLKREIK